MKRLIAPLAILALLALFLAQPAAAAIPVPAAPEIAAKGYLLVDFNSGQTLAESKADERMEPASLTKLMTAYVVFHALKEGTIHLPDMVTISERAWRTEGSRMFVEVGKQVAVEDLIQGMIVQSGNDASVALAEFVAGSEDSFADLMNRYAEKVGMKATHFMNATGLPDPQHYTTARDILTLTRALINEFPEYYRWYSQKKFTYNGITQYNRNKLVWRDPSVDGVKTGHTDSAGFCLVTSAKREDMRLLAVVLGTDSEKARAHESQSLLNYGFRFYESHKLYGAGQELAKAKIWKGEESELSLGPAHDIWVTIPRGQYKRLSAAMEIDATIVAPVTKGQRLGTVKISLDSEPMVEQPLVAQRDVPEGGMFGRMVDSVMLMFE